MKESKLVQERYYNDGHKTLFEYNSNKIDTLFNLYSKDKLKARIYYMNDTSDFRKDKLILFTKSNGDFSIVLFSRTFGISKTNKMYNREKRLFQVHYSNNKFVIVNNIKKAGSKFVPPTYNNFYHFNCGNFQVNNIIIELLSSRFAWVRFIHETPALQNISLNTFINKKLFTLKAALNYHLKCPFPIGKIIISSKLHGQQIHMIKNHIEYIDNIESLKAEWLKNNVGLFFDTLKMAKTLNKKLNASWTTRRLREEHDKWAKLITDVIFIDGDKEMKILDIYKEFADKYNYKLLRTTKDMAIEGKKMNHCVATYISKVENGYSGIYSVGDYTLELTTTWGKGVKILCINQFRGYSNIDAPQKLKDKVIADLSDYAEFISKRNGDLEKFQPEIFSNELPF